jgi:hypothetical protein
MLHYFGNNESYVDKSMSLLNYFNLINNFEKEIEQSLISDDPYFLEEWDESEHDVDAECGIGITGQKNYFEYLSFILLSCLKEDWDGVLRVKEIEIYELDDDDYKVMIDFVKFIRNLTIKD